jgi:hypothetical protein
MSGTIFIISGLILTIIESRRHWKARQAALSWSIVYGSVINSDLKPYKRYNASGHGWLAFHSPIVSYRYTVNRKKYLCNQISFGLDVYDYDTAKKKLLTLSPRTTIAIYYDPEHPSNAVLEPRLKGNESFLFLGIALLMIGILAVTWIPLLEK